MIPKVTYGSRVRGLLEYLWGPGKAEEHVNPHLVAGYDDVALLAPERHERDGGRWGLDNLAARLDAPQIAAGERGVKQYVWQCSLSLPAQEGQLDDDTWGRIAGRFVQEMGFTGDADRAGCRWIAVRHGLSAKGNDHVHLVVTLATEDGAPVWLRQDKRRSQQVTDKIEDEFGLGKWTPGRAGATRRPELTRPEVDRARRSGLAPDRELLRRQVRAALAGADSETDWVARMKGAGLLVATRTATKDVDQVVGYAVALRPSGGGKPRWFAGRNLDGDLSLTRIRARWSDEGRATAGQWADAHSAESPRLRGEDRVAVWRSSAAALEAISGRLRGLPPGSPQWPAVARASAELLAGVAMATEPSGQGPITRAADSLARAAAPRRSTRTSAASTVAAELGRVADALLLAGRARDGGEAAVLLAVVVQAARLVVALAELRAAERQAHAAGAAAAAAAHLMPLLQQGARHVDQIPTQTQTGAADRTTVPSPTPARPSAHREGDERALR
ncbi:relaxase/mobilization nuclease domain-containing protein [Micromonospora sp. NPDC049903]|uniref:relaxase/mobilization nuclease domain-containing protein n=1 Tax=Micromonospora sp. NPDC049903 TaxID=3364276 RepID=UPI0037B2D305